ncbi:MAG TPA: radical SAM protein [Spirochaetota bacterium]|nr:radical SAM protein [Spirochaetota bacterium]HNT11660.1 radical SAM protein [Spirochaetota bacterium]
MNAPAEVNASIDILFISPSNEKLGRFHRFVPRSVPLGVGILSGYLMQFGFRPEIADEEIVTIDRSFLTDAMRRMTSPPVFGISTMTTNAMRAYAIAGIIKEIDAASIIIFGGIHPTVMPEEVMNNESIDFIVQGEGEQAIVDLMKQFKSGKVKFNDIRGLGYRDEQGVHVYTERDSKPFDINKLEMFPYQMFNPLHYDLGFILSSRGCPFDCIFCSQRAITRRRYRALDNQKTIEELKFLINDLGQKNITFFDDYFTGDKKRVMQLCAMIREHRLHHKCSFGVQTRGDSIDREILTEMKQSGFDSLMFGFETSSNHLMKIINKKETVEDNINAIILAREIGFTVEATFIFGFPGEVYSDRIKALHIAKAIIDRARFNNATPYPGTKLYEIAVSQNRLNVMHGWENFSSAGAVTASAFKRYDLPYCPEKTKPSDLIGQVFLANLLFYMNTANLKRLFNTKKKGSGKWFELPKQNRFNPVLWIDFLLLASNVFLRLIYYMLFSRECRRFFFDGFFREGKS